MESKQTDQSAAAAESIASSDDQSPPSPTLSVTFLLQLINSFRDPVFIKDRQHRWILVNDALCNLLGQDRSHLIGKSDADFLPAAQAQICRERDEQIFTTGIAHETEELVTSATGDRLCLSTQKSLIHDETGAAFLMTMICDVTPHKQIEQDLQAAQDHFQLVIDNIPQAIWWKDQNLIYLGCNQAAATAAGLTTPAEMIGKTDFDLPRLCSRAEFICDRDRDLMRSRQPQLHLVRPQAGDQQIWLDISKVPLRNAAGQVEGILGMLEDITDRQRIEAALRDSEERFRTLTTNLPIALYRILYDADWTIEYISDFFEVLTGYPVADFTEHRTRTWESLIHPDDRARIRQIVEMSIAVCQPFELEYRLQHRDGSVCWVYEKGQGKFDSAGNLMYLTGAVLDVTDRKRAEAALQYSETQFRSLTSNLPAVIYRCLCDEAWTQIFVSDFAEKLTGYPASDFINNAVRTWESVIHPDDRQPVGELVYAAIANRQPYELEFRIVHCDGSIRWVYEKGQGTFDEVGNLLYLDGAIMDITDRKRAETALQHSEIQLRTLTNNLPAVIYRCQCDQDWTMLFLSDFAERITGYPTTDFINSRVRSWSSIIHPDDRRFVEQIGIEAIANGQPYELEFRILRSDGSVCWVYEKGQGKFDSAGNLLFLDGAMIDISDRKVAEAALQRLNEELEAHILDRTAQLEQKIQEHRQTEADLRESQQRLALLIEQTPLAVIEWNLQLQVTEWNSAAEQIFGYRREEAIGKPLGFLSDAQQPMVDQAIQEIVLAQRSPRRSVGENQTKSGKPIICEWHDYPLIAEDGEVIGFASLAQDVTDRKRTEEALKRQFTAIEASLNGVALCDAEGQFTYMNQAHAEIYGYDHPQELIGQHWSILYDELERQRFEQEIMPLFARTGRWHGESIGRRRDGSTFLEETAIAVTADGSLVCVVQDITDRKLAETAIKQSEMKLRQRAEQLEYTLQELQRTQAQLIQSEKMSSLGQLVAGVAHEINNPVNFISGNLTHAHSYMQDLIGLLQLYQQHYPNPIAAVQAETEAIDLDFLLADLPKLLTSMQVGVERIEKIVRSLRNFSRMDEAEKKAVDLHDGIESTLVILQNRLKAAPTRPEIDIIRQYDSLPQIECYASQLNQVFMNLISNAIDAIEERLAHSSNLVPCIRISTAITSTEVQICIADNGAGIPAEILPRLFDPFFTTKPIGKGTGMGLSISYQIITEKHGGSLKCQSTVGEGTEFTIVIPIQLKAAIASNPN